jgi:replication-associated recombination protein RarA
MKNPSSYIPTNPDDFIGGANKVGKILHTKAKSLAKGSGNMKVLIYGAPGVGKTAIANMVAATLTRHPTEVESLNGRNVTLDVVRRWQQDARYASLLGGWTVKIVNEMDLCPQAAQDVLLTYLDELPLQFAFIGTSNLQLDLLVERFQTRLQQFKVTAPQTSELAEFIAKRWKLAKAACNQIAVGSGGNVRAALLDTESMLDAQA